MTVLIVDAWQQQDDFGQNGLTFVPGGLAGTGRVAILIVAAEVDGSIELGPMSIASATLGGRTVTLQYQDQVGADNAYHNTVAFCTLDDDEIELMSGGAFLVTWTNFLGQGTFETSPVVHYATYRNVNPANINSAQQNNQAGSVLTLSPSATMNVAVDEKVIVVNIGGQPFVPSSSVGGLTERTEYIGAANDMTLAVYDRDAVTADSVYTWTVDLDTATRMITVGIALGHLEVVTTTEQDAFGFYADGTESGAATLAAQNVDISIGKSAVFGIRQGGQLVGPSPPVTVTCEYKKTGDADAEFRKLL